MPCCIDMDFSGANLTNADLTGATLKRARGLDTATTTGDTRLAVKCIIPTVANWLADCAPLPP